jgi:S-adenosylmethionine:tRNA ribosyltransferase-isomerase
MINAALFAWKEENIASPAPFELHLSTHLPGDLWLVEMRQRTEHTTRPFFAIRPGETFHLAGGATIVFHALYLHRGNRVLHTLEKPELIPQRLWIATIYLPEAWATGIPETAENLQEFVKNNYASSNIPTTGQVPQVSADTPNIVDTPLQMYLRSYGFPIRYSYVREQWPLAYYQSAFVTEQGSAEMPSAGRAFTSQLITSLMAQGVLIVPLLLHTGVASLEDGEPTYEEYYRVSSETARQVNTARITGRRVIAVGTTVVRALETVTDTNGQTHSGEGWTSLVITPERGLHAVNALLTGLHEPRATHLFMLEALAGREHLQIAYQEALRVKYLWHEFGDLHLILP